MTLILGVDGCRSGWCAVPVDAASCAVGEQFIAPSFDELRASGAAVIAIDIPIGLASGPDNRLCDIEARHLLGRAWPRVFLPPVRGAIAAGDYREACTLNQWASGRMISRQCFGIVPKIREVDAAMKPGCQERVFEAHPELAFFALNDGHPVLEGKKTLEGRGIRWRLLRSMFPGLPPEPPRSRDLPPGCAVDDYIDALATAWTGICIARGTAERIPPEPETDGVGLRMEMWMPALTADNRQLSATAQTRRLAPDR
jgi:predicted RNase H-like nuclease